MPRVRCPRCSTVVEVAPGETPVCPACGYGQEHAVPAPQAAAPQAAAPAPAVDPWDTEGRAGYGSPAAPAAAVGASADAGPPGKVRSPGIVVLLFLVTFGIYPLIWHWKTGVETDAFRPSTRSAGMLKGYVWLSIVTMALSLIAIAIFLAAFLGSEAFQNLEDPNYEPTDEEVAEIIFSAIGGVLLLLLSVVTSIVALVLQLMGLWRVWGAAADEQRRLGLVPLNTTLLLLFLLSPVIASFIQFPFAFIPVLGVVISWLLSIAGTVLMLIAFYKTQVGLNQIWQAHGTP